MSIKQLRAAIAPCCGLGANRSEVDAALDDVSLKLSTQQQLLVEVFHIIDSAIVDISLLRKPLNISSPTVQNLVTARDTMKPYITGELNHDALQTNSKNLRKSASQGLVFNKEEAIKNEYCRLSIIVVNSGYKCLGYPFDFAASARCIKRRLRRAVIERDFIRAARLDVTRAALQRLETRLLNAKASL
ncbi:hypothetical protein ACNZ70_001935 [Vibrio mimicus]